ncbi:MAG TPA: hypothetical protein VFO85_21535 [Vicinamibacteria bacterium]|nr:hypothetical protein [Vicinamibacteria bacterium]
MSDYTPQPYPRWVGDVVADNAEEETAVLEGRAVIETVKSAQGEARRIVGIRPKERPALAPAPEPAAPAAPPAVKAKAPKRKRR